VPKSDDIKLHPIDLDRYVDRCTAFLRDSFNTSFGSDEVWSKTYGEDGHRYIEWLSNYAGYMLHAWRRNEIVGELMFNADRNYLQHIYVVPKFRRTGLGQYLLCRFVCESRNAGCESAFLAVSRTNRPAIAFYQKQGWVLLEPDSTDPKLDIYRLDLLAKADAEQP
jgi:ribosomal protein S18 acetylase RimI-like enzyme